MRAEESTFGGPAAGRRSGALPCVWVLAALLARPGALPGQEPPSPYADETDREIKALAPEEVAGLLDGSGLGFAKAAELNGVPGPRHVVALAGDLGLTESQLLRVQATYDRMHEEAVSLGTAVVELERQLDRAFAAGVPERSEVERLAGEIGVLRGRLRGVHLVAHLETAEILTPHQVHAYNELRGYATGPHEHEETKAPK